MSHPEKQLKDHWEHQSIKITLGVKEEQIKNFESKYGMFLPTDVRNYFLCMNGMGTYWPNDRDREGFSFWPLERVKAVGDELENLQTELLAPQEARTCFLFADYLDWSWAYAMRLSESYRDPSPVILVGMETLIQVADSFTEFVGLYVMDSPKLYGDLTAYGC
ncbi:SMI1/KNR4 family protein [Candidatus Entotheonella palauensis]|uniref:Knr4/Smi1-like domain-containing protein n=1 Tax=Candidatus Entotheonella gemina TaxID=1429439 RepID=W4MG38_9BACT|nr:SMI1/KNR4 family protein [Candidatus Entotheonella palauensis]ETX08871.1 MAG: hypothetical protein ETSY2_02835 [Candidatus Entotheonella gemina]